MPLPTDDFALAEFDGTNLYEHSDPREGYHQDWNTLIHNYGRREVSNFLVGNALYWIERFGIDALRVDAVASMIYRDYSRKEGSGSLTNLAVARILKRLNSCVIPTVFLVSRFPGSDNGGGVYRFRFVHRIWAVWASGTSGTSAGCMTPDYMKLDPIYRQYHHDKLTFGMLYNYTENFVPRCRMMKWSTVKNRFSTGCRATHGRNSLTCAPTTAGCGHSGQETTVHGERIAVAASGTMTPASTGIC